MIIHLTFSKSSKRRQHTTSCAINKNNEKIEITKRNKIKQILHYRIT